MTSPRSTAARREELIARCRQERAALAGLTGAAAAHLHWRELSRLVRRVRAVARMLTK